MVDFGLFSGAIQLALVINEMARAAQANKVSCMAMNHRIQIANEIIKVAFEQHKANPKSVVISESAFKMYFQLLERMRDFVAEISKRKTFAKVNPAVSTKAPFTFAVLVELVVGEGGRWREDEVRPPPFHIVIVLLLLLLALMVKVSSRLDGKKATYLC